MKTLMLLLCGAICSAGVVVVPTPSANPVERLAAAELVSYLSRLYPDEKFAVTDRAGDAGPSIVFRRVAGPAESFSISAANGRAVIAAADARGALFGVYALLEKLGCGFYLSYETLPPPRAGALRFDGWTLRDEPLVQDRIVFDWHNFLSSASTWEFDDWQRYVDRAARMRFNDLMVHAYGNNPMFTFRFAGIEKPVGFLATTVSGRDWGTEHVNDVRRMIGGELFTAPVFGASIAQVPLAERVPAATALMKRVFAYAATRGLGVTFALDVDTESANPQAMIATLPARARIPSGPWQLANPDTPEGYAFYKAQTEQLLSLYPEITRLAVWFRNNRTPWMDVQLRDFPEPWKREFHGDAADAPMFAMGRVVAAFGRALRETGHGNVELAAGSWRLLFVKAADRYLPREATLLPLDWATVFDTPAGQRSLREVRSGRKLVPIVWAHHDDRTYIGRPYTPYVNFAGLLESTHASGFGIIHWTTRPLDLYFKATQAQVWRSTKNQPLEEACDEMAVRTFGAVAREVGHDYLFSWVTEGPMFGRETTDMFIDIPLVDPVSRSKSSRAREQMLAGVQGGEQAAYFRAYERFQYSFLETHHAFEKAQALVKAQDYDGARAVLETLSPEQVIRLYVEAARHGGPTPGEKALVVSMNLRWLPYFLSLRQAVGLEPVRVRIGKVEREPLAQGAGTNTFHFDEQGRLWKVVEPAGATMELGGIMGDALRPGRYRVNGGEPVEAVRGRVTVKAPPAGTEMVLTRDILGARQ